MDENPLNAKIAEFMQEWGCMSMCEYIQMLQDLEALTKYFLDFGYAVGKEEVHCD